MSNGGLWNPHLGSTMIFSFYLFLLGNSTVLIKVLYIRLFHGSHQGFIYQVIPWY